MVTYQLENAYNLLEEVKPLFEDHYNEIAWKKDKIKLNPDYPAYFKLYKQGYLHVATARREGELIGYCISVAQPLPHYKDTLCAVNDVLYVSKEHRGGNVGYELLEFVENDLKENGVDMFILHVKKYAPFDGLLEARGFSAIETNYSKYLGD